MLLHTHEIITFQELYLLFAWLGTTSLVDGTSESNICYKKDTKCHLMRIFDKLNNHYFHVVKLWVLVYWQSFVSWAQWFKQILKSSDNEFYHVTIDWLKSCETENSTRLYINKKYANYTKTYKICSSIFNCSFSHIDRIIQDCSNPSANALGLLQSCTKHGLH